MNMRYLARRCLHGFGILVALSLTACGAPRLGATTAATTTTVTGLPHADAPCSRVEHVEENSLEATRILANLLDAILARSPGHGATPVGFAEVRSITRAGDWVLVQASFTRVFEPGIFVLQRSGNGYRYDGELWSGLAESMEEIRSTLAERVPSAPRELFRCLEETSWFGLSVVDTPETTAAATAGPATEPSAPGARTTPATADALAELNWTRKQFGTAWNIEYPSDWSVNAAGTHAGALSLEGSYGGRSYAIHLSYPIIEGLDTLTLDDWVQREVSGPKTAVRDVTVAGTAAKKVLGVHQDAAQPEQHRVYIWRHGATNPRLVTIHHTDGGSVTETMKLLLDRFVAGIEAVRGDMPTAAPATTMTDGSAGVTLAKIRREVKHPIWVPTDLPAELAPSAPTLVTSGPLITIEYRTSDGSLVLHVVNGAAGCCLDADPRKYRNPVQLASGLTAYFLPVERQYGGNILWWQEEGTYVALSGPELSKDQLMQIATTMSSTADLS